MTPVSCATIGRGLVITTPYTEFGANCDVCGIDDWVDKAWLARAHVVTSLQMGAGEGSQNVQRRTLGSCTTISGGKLHQLLRPNERSCVPTTCAAEFAVSTHNAMGKITLKRPSTLPGIASGPVYGKGRATARRQLFGPVDHDQLRSDWRREITRLVEEKGREWNFDFGRETPLEGAYTWEKVDGLEERCSRAASTCQVN
ncbi:CDKN1B [Branchiostoma lanceolatum]|uniref:CDKN1B protein n=1 Tax=Branchiostoma lanceolatum TaxID=7740 RepID=A0A8K0ELF0_BRALA|nr:CDKN1B [Branchiostoma lanceolatum]